MSEKSTPPEGELLRKCCPFCGRNAYLETYSRMPFHKDSTQKWSAQIRCDSTDEQCGLLVQSESEFESEREAITYAVDKWNRRVPA